MDKNELIYKIITTHFDLFTEKQLKTLIKIIDEFKRTNEITENPDVESTIKKVIQLRDEYKEYLEDTGYVENGIEYTWLNKMNKIVDQK